MSDAANPAPQYTCSFCTRPEFDHMPTSVGRYSWCKLHNAARVLRHASRELRLAHRGLPRPLTADADRLVERLIKRGQEFDAASKALDEWLDTDPERTWQR